MQAPVRSPAGRPPAPVRPHVHGFAAGMPEGPSIVLLREAAERFRGRTVRQVSGNSREDLARMQGREVVDVRSWGKHFLLEFDDFSMRIHLMMFGSWLIDERKPAPPRVSLRFDDGELSFYACSVKFIDQPLDEVYDWRAASSR